MLKPSNIVSESNLANKIVAKRVKLKIDLTRFFSYFVSGKQILFFDALPNHFTRKEAIELGANFNIAERAEGSFLNSCLRNYLQQPEYATYTKTI